MTAKVSCVHILGLLLLLLGLVLGEEPQGTCAFEAQGAHDDSSCSGEELQEERDIRKGLDEIEEQLEVSRNAVAKLVELIEKQEKKLSGLKERRGLGNSQKQRAEFQEGNNALQPYGTIQGKIIARHRETFHDHFGLLAAMKADAEVTCIHAMHSSGDGLSRYAVLGDANGALSFFSMKGDLLWEHQTGLKSPVTSMVSFFVDRNHTALLTGHADGSLRKHIILDKVTREYLGGPLEPNIVRIDFQGELLPLPNEGGKDDNEKKLDIIASGISHLETTKAGNMRLLFLADDEGSFKSMYVNGTIKTSQKLQSSVVAMRADRAHVAVIHETGLGVFSSITGRFLRNLECDGLEKTFLHSASFDQKITSRIYVASKDGELLSLFVDKEFKSCKVRRRQPIRLPPGPVRMGAVKGYIVLSAPLGVAIYNITMSSKTGPRETILEPHVNIANAFGQQVEYVSLPHVETGGDSLLVLGLGGGLVAMFESHLPTFRPPDMKTNIWNQPIFIGAMVLVGFWQFSKHRNPPTPSISSHNRQYGREKYGRSFE